MSSKKEPLNRKQVASLLRVVSSDILTVWETQARQRVPAAQKQSKLALQDSLPEFIEQMACTIIAYNPDSQKQENYKVAREHGEDRAHQQSYTLVDIVAEFRLLRAIVIQKLEVDTPIDTESQRLIHDYVDRGVGEAVSMFAELDKKNLELQKTELESIRHSAEQASSAKSAFLANMSHEIRTPLGAIMGFVELIKDSNLQPVDVQSYLSIIERNSQHLLRIIDDILDLSKVEAGKMVIEKIEFSFAEFMAEFSSLVGIKARDNGIVFEFSASTLLPEKIISDPTRLRQILSNVVGNAIKFTEKGKVELAAAYQNNQIKFQVTDTGRGISFEQRKNLFKAFSQADSSTTRKFGGTGLGLILVKNLSEALGGDFVLTKSELGVGSVFTITIPVDTPKKVVLSALQKVRILANPEEIKMVAANSLQGLKILLMEDSPDNQLLIQRILAATGALITVANNGAEGVKLAMEHRFDILLVDIQMPVMDGHEAVRYLRAKDYAGPIVALTAHAMKDEREKAVVSGFSHFLTKPIHRKSLIDLMSHLYRPLT
ncbi:MAG: response regulator [Bdellovibrionaceae bacterium]|nr:response regulator [Bdellovibrio sp.]